MRRMMLVAGGLLGVVAALAAAPQPASAHPLGNFSVNQLAALDLYPDRVEVAAAVDIAELPTLQEFGGGTTERAGYAEEGCAAFAHDFQVSVAGSRLEWTIVKQRFGYEDGAAGLATSRLDCALVAEAALGQPATIGVANRFREDRVGWRELTATGHGVRLIDSPLPVRSVSDGYAPIRTTC